MLKRQLPHMLRNPIQDDRLVLRPFLAIDVDLMFAAVDSSREALGRWLTWCSPTYSKDDTRGFIKANQQPVQSCEYALGIFSRASGSLFGGIGINQVDLAARRANLGYWVRSDCVSQGIASHAARLLAPCALEDLGLERIEIVAAIGNVASQRAAEKAGALREGLLRRRLRTPSGQADAICYSLIRSDFGLPPLEV